MSKMTTKRQGSGFKFLRCFSSTGAHDDRLPDPGFKNGDSDDNDINNKNGNHNQVHSEPHSLPYREAVPASPNRSAVTSTGRGSDGEEANGNRSQMTTPSIPKDVNEFRQNPGYDNVDIFTFNEMMLATKLFRPNFILGEGGFGVVYRGVIDDSVRPGYPTTEVAVKQLNLYGFQGDKEWLTEVSYLGQLSHQNLVKLIGYCFEDGHRLLVYEYMALGCLEKHLFQRKSFTLTWQRRIKIALDAAKGLGFLHGLKPPIIYRDLKTSNILLDSNFNAKLSDFGLAREGPKGDKTHVSTRVMGTHGYAAPEYVITGHLTTRSDVYGFGVILVEMLIGRKAQDICRSDKEQNMADWCLSILKNSKRLPQIIDPKINRQYTVRAIESVANLAHQCLSQNPKERPLMNRIVELLEFIYEQEASREMP